MITLAVLAVELPDEVVEVPHAVAVVARDEADVVALVLQPVLAVPVDAVRARLDRRAPLALEGRKSWAFLALGLWDEVSGELRKGEKSIIRVSLFA